MGLTVQQDSPVLQDLRVRLASTEQTALPAQLAQRVLLVPPAQWALLALRARPGQPVRLALRVFKAWQEL